MHHGSRAFPQSGFLRRALPRLTAVVVLCAATLSLAPPAHAATLVKMATLVPAGSVWDKLLKDMGAEWQEATGGEVQLRVYAGGVAGDEPDVVRKIRIGQIHAAAFTVTGLSEIDEGFDIFQVPMFYESYGELNHVLAELRPELEKRLEAKGYVLLNWGHGGWVHFFSRKPIHGVEDLQKQKIFVWAGNDQMVRLWRENDFEAVPLAATDITTGLQTGMIDALPTTPLAALSLQWFRQTPYMQELGLAPLIGGTVISKKIWDRISPQHQKKLREAAAETERQLMAQIPEQDAKAVEEMKKRGLTVVEISPEITKEWRKAADRLFQSEVDKRSDDLKSLLGRAQAARDAFRAKQ